MHGGLAEGMQGQCEESLRGVQVVPGEQIWKDAWRAARGECRCTKEDVVLGHAGGYGGDAGALSEGCHGLPEEPSREDAWGLPTGEGGEVLRGIGSTKDDEVGRGGKPGGQCWGMQRDAGRCGGVAGGCSRSSTGARRGGCSGYTGLYGHMQG